MSAGGAASWSNLHSYSSFVCACEAAPVRITPLATPGQHYTLASHPRIDSSARPPRPVPHARALPAIPGGCPPPAHHDRDRPWGAPPPRAGTREPGRLAAVLPANRPARGLAKLSGCRLAASDACPRLHIAARDARGPVDAPSQDNTTTRPTVLSSAPATPLTTTTHFEYELERAGVW